MNFLVLALFLILIIQPISIYAENADSDLQNSTKQAEVKSSSSKIHPVLIKWQTSEDPAKFAQENNLLYNDNRITVYIHLISEEFHSVTANEIDVISSYKKIAVANVSSEQLDELNKLDFIEKITPPHLAQTPPIPVQEITQTHTQEEKDDDYLWWAVLGGCAIFVIIALKYKKSKNKPKLN